MTMNVVLVVFDTLRKDAVGSYGLTPPWELGRIATPNLDAFARESIRLTNAYPESLPTLCARRAIYTGQRTYPFHNGDFRALKGDFTLVEDQARRSMEMFSEAMRMWMPFTAGGNPADGAPELKKPPAREEEIESLRRQLREMQKTIETIAERK